MEERKYELIAFELSMMYKSKQWRHYGGAVGAARPGDTQYFQTYVKKLHFLPIL